MGRIKMVRLPKNGSAQLNFAVTLTYINFVHALAKLVLVIDKLARLDQLSVYNVISGAIRAIS